MNLAIMRLVRGMCKTAIHSQIHTDIYYENVYNLLIKVQTQKDAIKILEKIGDDLIKNTFKYSK